MRRLGENGHVSSPASQSESTCGSPADQTSGGGGDGNGHPSSDSASIQQQAANSGTASSSRPIPSSSTPTYSSTSPASWTLSTPSDNSLGKHSHTWTALVSRKCPPLDPFRRIDNTRSNLLSLVVLHSVFSQVGQDAGSCSFHISSCAVLWRSRIYEQTDRSDHLKYTYPGGCNRSHIRSSLRYFSSFPLIRFMPVST